MGGDVIGEAPRANNIQRPVILALWPLMHFHGIFQITNSFDADVVLVHHYNPNEAEVQRAVNQLVPKGGACKVRCQWHSPPRYTD